jgi:hypothetical protein
MKRATLADFYVPVKRRAALDQKRVDEIARAFSTRAWRRRSWCEPTERVSCSLRACTAWRLPRRSATIVGLPLGSTSTRRNPRRPTSRSCLNPPAACDLIRGSATDALALPFRKSGNRVRAFPLLIQPSSPADPAVTLRVPFHHGKITTRGVARAPRGVKGALAREAGARER